MALMIGTKKPPQAPPVEEPLPEKPMPEPEAPPEEAPEPEPEEPTEDPGLGPGVVPPEIAGYRGPEMGPFFCANCQHYGVAGHGTCEVVSGKIDEQGLCNLFNSVDEHQPEMSEEEGEPTDVPPTEAPPPELDEEAPPQ